MALEYLGIDVSKKSLDCALWRDGKFLDKTCPNTPAGFKQLLAWLAHKKASEVHVCLEATGRFEEAAATALYEAGHAVSVLNPLSVHAFAQQRLTRSKTDQIDARTLAEYGRRNADDLRLWAPPPRELTELRELVGRRQALVEMKTQETNRLSMATSGPVVDAMVKQHVEYLDLQIAAIDKAIRDHINRHPGLKSQRDLLVSIPGVGNQTASLFLAEVGAKLATMKSVKQLVRYCGMDIQQRQSGTSLRGRPRISKVGNAVLRAGLFMPARCAMRFNPLVADLDQRLLEAQKSYMVRVGAAMRKLLHLMYGVLKTRTVFNAALARPLAALPT